MLIKKILTVVIFLSLLLTLGALPIESSEGNEEVVLAGSEDEPYLIENVHQLQNMSEDLTAHYELAGNIDARETEEWNDDRGFLPIGDTENRFKGVLHGRGYKITGLHIDRGNQDHVGLIGFLDEEGIVRDVGLVDSYVKGYWRVGSLVGWNTGLVEDSYASGRVAGDYHVGGLVGLNRGTIDGCYAAGSAVGDELYDHYIGGLVGENGGTVSNSYAAVNVTGNDYVGGLAGGNDGVLNGTYATGSVEGEESIGGLVGKNEDTVEHSHAVGNVLGHEEVGGLLGVNSGVVKSSYAQGTVGGDSFVGGLVGRNEGYSTVKRSYSVGDVTGQVCVGGLIGENGRGCLVEDSYALGNVDGDERVGGSVGQNFEGIVKNSYATGNVSGYEEVGGLVGRNNHEVSDSFWDVETTEQDGSDGGTGKTTAEMKDVATFTDLSTEGLDEPWDLVGDPYDDEDGYDIWDMDGVTNQGYPFLAWEIEPEVYELSVGSTEGGTVLQPGEDTFEYTRGTEIELQAAADQGHTFVGWAGDNETIEDTESYKTTMFIMGNYTLEARFQEEIEYYELELNIEGEGDVVVEPEQEDYEEGTEVTLTAVPEEGWEFVEWVGDVESEEEVITVVMDENKSLTAYFYEDVEHFYLIVKIQGEGHVELDPERDRYVDGSEVELTALADEDWSFVEWTNGVESEDAKITVVMDENRTVTAHFEELAPAEFEFSALTVEPEEPELGDEVEISIDVTNVGELEGVYTVEFYLNGELICEETVEVEAGETETVTTIYGLKEAGDYEIEGEGHVFIFNIPKETYELSIHIEGKGTVEVDGDAVEDGWTEIYEENEEVVLTAEPDEKYLFQGWTGDVESSEEEITVVMDHEKMVIARFEVETYGLTIEIGRGEGRVEVDGRDGELPYSQEYEEGESVSIRALPGEDHGFQLWEGVPEGLENESEITMEVESDMDLTVHFEEEEDTPGFTVALLAVAVITAAVLKGWVKKVDR